MTRRIPVVIAASLVLLMGAVLKAEPQQTVDPSRARGILDVVVLDEDGKRLRGVTVAVPGFRSTTGLGGSCRFKLVPGRYSVLIRKTGYRGRRINAGVKPDETTTLRVQLEKLPVARSPKK
jgi:hypothetical protein